MKTLTYQLKLIQKKHTNLENLFKKIHFQNLRKYFYKYKRKSSKIKMIVKI